MIKRIIGAALALLLVAAAPLQAFAAESAWPQESIVEENNERGAGDLPVTRLYGKTRTETAVAISQGIYSGSGNGTVMIASGDNYADALVGVTLANKYYAPILLVQKDKGLDEATAAEIKRLETENVIILGGTGAVPAIENELKELGCTNVKRISGKDRFDTAVKIAQELYEGKSEEPTGAVFVYSNNYPDALSVGPFAAMINSPILYINGKGVLDEYTKAYLEGFKTKPMGTVIVGGTGAISADAEENIKPYFGQVTRVSGKDRYATSIEFNKMVSEIFDHSAVCVATGESFPDALAGGVYCCSCRAPLVLVPKDADKAGIQVQYDFIMNFGVGRIAVFGGEGAVSKNIADILATAHDS